MLSHKRGSKKRNLDWAALFSVHIHSGEMEIVTIRFLQSPSVIQRHLFFEWGTHSHRFVIPLVHCRVAQLTLPRPDHSAIQADEAMLTLDSGSVSLSCSALGDSVQTIWLRGRHSDSFTFDTAVLRCVAVAPLGMFLSESDCDSGMCDCSSLKSIMQTLDLI